MLKSFRLLNSFEQRELQSIIKESALLKNNTCFLKNNYQSKTLAIFQTNTNVSTIPRKYFHTITNLRKKEEEEDKPVLVFTEFEKEKTKNKKKFLQLVELYETNFQNRSGHVDFIRTALKHMKEYGVHKDATAYKKLLNILPRGVFVAKTNMQVAMMYHPRTQYVVGELLDKMEQNKITPDVELGNMLIEIFGKFNYPTVKFYRWLYWYTKFQNVSPWELPKVAPSDALELGKLAIKQISSVDIQTEISIFDTLDVPDSIDKTWVVSAQSPKQKELLQNHSPETPVVVEGGDIVWIRDKFISYYVLKADSEPIEPEPPEDLNDFSQMDSPYFNPYYKEKRKEFSVHEQDDGIIYGVCATGTSTKDSLLSWIRLLQKNGNPVLEKVPVLFRFKSAEKTLVSASDELVVKEK